MTEYSEIMRDYTEFLDAVLLFRYTRDTSPAKFPVEEWLSRRLDDLAANGRENPEYWTEEVVEYLSLASKVAELIDDRKAELLEEIHADLRKVGRPAGEEQVAA